MYWLLLYCRSGKKWKEVERRRSGLCWTKWFDYSDNWEKINQRYWQVISHFSQFHICIFSLVYHCLSPWALGNCEWHFHYFLTFFINLKHNRSLKLIIGRLFDNKNHCLLQLWEWHFNWISSYTADPGNNWSSRFTQSCNLCLSYCVCLVSTVNHWQYINMDSTPSYHDVKVKPKYLLTMTDSTLPLIG